MGDKEFDFSRMLDNKYSSHKAQILDGKLIDRKRFRGYLNTNELIDILNVTEYGGIIDEEESGGCSESCEPFMSESNE